MTFAQRWQWTGAGPAWAVHGRCGFPRAEFAPNEKCSIYAAQLTEAGGVVWPLRYGIRDN